MNSLKTRADPPALPAVSTSAPSSSTMPPTRPSQVDRLTEVHARRFWQHAMNVAEHHEDDFKHQALPLARIKKVAKMDPEVQVRRLCHLQHNAR